MRATASATDFSAMSSGAGRCCISSTRPANTAGKDYKIVRGELAADGAGLAEKPEIVALSKIDAVDADHLKKQRERLKRAIASAGPETHDRHPAPLLLSSASRAGVREALRAVFDAIEAQKAYERASEAGGPGLPDESRCRKSWRP